MQSFSKEWLEYDYDGVLWDLSYSDHKRRVYAELGINTLHDVRVFLELGCGLGMTTHYAQEAFQGDAIGVDLSLAALSATQQFRNNPFLHFVQASVFKLPLKESLADVVYSHGVLHHTYSTRDAFLALAPYCRPGGMIYVWLYGSESQRGSLGRRLAWRLEAMTRPHISRHLNTPVARVALGMLALPYLAVNAWHRANDPSVQKYDYVRALHAARDRFTPLYAHRHDFEEVAEWFTAAGFERIEQVDWRQMPTANQDNYKRNVGVRGWRRSQEQSS